MTKEQEKLFNEQLKKESITRNKVAEIYSKLVTFYFIFYFFPYLSN